MSQAGSISIGGGGDVVETLTGDVGVATAAANNINVIANIASNNCGCTVQFTGMGDTLTLNVTDINQNTVIGLGAGNFPYNAADNTILGYQAGKSNTSSSLCTFIGSQAGQNVTSGTDHTLLGASAGASLVDTLGCVFLGNGAGANVNGNYDICIGSGAGRLLSGGDSDNIMLGCDGVGGDDNTIRIGNQGSGDNQQDLCYIAGIAGATITAVSPTYGAVIIDTSDGQLLSTTTGISTSGFVLTSNGTASAPTWKATGTSSVTFTGDSGTPFSGNAVTVTGGTTGLTFAASSPDLTLTGTLKLANGGTNASLTASNGGIFYSTATAGAILAGTATASQVLLSGASTTPAWSTATYPASTTVNQILYSSSSNVIAGLATANSSSLVTSAAGVPTWLGPMTNGQMVIGSTGAIPVSATLTPGTGISVTNGAGSVTIAATGTTTLTVTSVANGASPYTVLTTDQFLACQTSGGVITILLPNAPATGRTFIIKDSNGAAATSNISVTTVGGAVNIDGATTYTMNTNYQAINVCFDGTAYEVF